MPPALSDPDRIRRLEPPAQGARLSVVLDTDTFNEIDDQFALAYALLSPDRLDLQAVYAAPFCNDATDPATGMRQSYDEILRVLERFDRRPDGFVFTGSERWLTDAGAPVPSAAAEDLVARARRQGDDEVLYVVAIGAPTNVSSALLAAPDIAGKIVVVWLGGNPTTWPKANEYNLEQDVAASRVLLDSGVPLVYVPCVNVTEHLTTTLAEIDAFVRPTGPVGAYLAGIFEAYYDDHFARSKVIWDVGAVAWLVDPEWTPSALVHSPVLTSEGTWSHDPRRHLIREMRQLDRDAIFGDLFTKLRDAGAASGRMGGMSTAAGTDTGLAAYLDRIGVADVTSPDLPTLHRIIAGHTRSIAFENLDAFTGREIALDPDALAAKLVHGGRGGWCFEQNLLLRGALDAVGYTTTCLAARVMWGRPPDAPPVPRSHMLLRVDLPEGPHLVDVGFGGLTLTGVLALEPDVEQATPHEPFRLVSAERAGYVMQARVGGQWRPLYWFDLTEQLLADYEVSNWYLCHHPRSHFLSGIMAARPEPDRRYALGSTSLAVHHLDGPTERRTLESPAEIRKVLEETFLIDTSGLPDLETALARLFQDR